MIFQDMFFGCIIYMHALTSMNMVATGGDPKVLDMETFCVFSSQSWIHHRQYQTQRLVVKIRATLDEM